MAEEYTDVYLIRHGRALNNLQSHLIGGRSDEAPLLDEGIRQAQQLGEVLLKKGIVPDVVYSSPARRAKQTGEYALQAMGLKTTIIEDERLHEQATGDWTGRLAADIFSDEQVRAIEALGKDFRSPNGESMNDVASRMQDWIEGLSSGSKRHPRVIFGFTHGGSIRSLASRMLNWTHQQTYQTRPDNTSVSVFKQVNGLWRPPEHIGLSATELAADTSVPVEISSRLAINEKINGHLESVIWFGSLRNNQDVHGHSDYDVQVVLDRPTPEIAAEITTILKDYPAVDLSIVYLKDIFDKEGKMIFQDGTKGPFFMYVLGDGKVLYGRNVYEDAVQGLTMANLRPALLFTIREYLSRLRVMVSQSPDNTQQFKKYSTKFFKDTLIYTGNIPFEHMTSISNLDACEAIANVYAFSKESMTALSKTIDYETNFTLSEMCHLLYDYEQIVDRLCNE